MMTKIDIINETVDYYREHIRAVQNGMCTMRDSETGAKCAVGRCLDDDVAENIFEEPNLNYGGVDDLVKMFGNIDRVLKEQYRGHSEEFWAALQVVHDSDNYWEDKELSEIGKARVELLKKQYARS